MPDPVITAPVTTVAPPIAPLVGAPVAPIATPVPTAPAQPGADKWLAHARKEQQLREGEAAARQSAQQLQQQQRSIQVQQQELTARRAEIDAFERVKALAKHDPMAYLKAGGIDGSQAVDFYQKYSAQILTGKPIEVGPGAEMEALKLQLAEEKRERLALEEKINGRITGAEGQFNQRLQQEEQAAQEQFTQALESYAAANVEQFPLVSSMGLTSTVADVINENYNRTGRIMSEKEAFTMVEDYYAGQLNKTGRYTAAQKAAAVQAAAEQAATPTTATPAQAPTLRSTTGVPAPMTGASATTAPMSDIDRALKKYEEVHAANVASGRYKST